MHKRIWRLLSPIVRHITGLKDSALAHLPSGKFTANAAWLVLASTATDRPRTQIRTALPHQAQPVDRGLGTLTCLTDIT